MGAKSSRANGAGHADPEQIARLEAETAEPLADLIHDAEGTVSAEAAVAAEREKQVAQVQAAVETGGIALERKVTFLGRKFRVSDKVGLFPLMMFSDAAESGMTTADPQALAAMWRMLRDCIHPDDWPEFVAHGTEQKCDDPDAMFDVCTQTITILTARPSTPPSASSPGRRRSSRGSTGSRSAPRGAASST